MTRRLPLLLVLSLALLPAQGFCVDDVHQDEKGTYLGALFGGHTRAGAVVTHVLPNSPAARADLRRNDVVLEYDRKTVRDANHLAQLIQADKPARKVPLVVLRGTRKLNVEATLALGLALKLANDNPEPPRPAATPGVSVRATPLESGKVQWMIEYGLGNEKKVLTCEGTAKELAATIQKLPERERQLVRIALERLRSLDAPAKKK
jgi:hypothetical protein